MKKLLAVFLAALLIASVLPLSVFAEGNGAKITFVNTSQGYNQVDRATALAKTPGGDQITASAYRFVQTYDTGYLQNYAVVVEGHEFTDNNSSVLDENKKPRNVDAGGIIYEQIESVDALYNPYLYYAYDQHSHEYVKYENKYEFSVDVQRFLPKYLDGLGNCSAEDVAALSEFTVDPDDYTSYNSKDYFGFGVIVGDAYQPESLVVYAEYYGKAHLLVPNSAGTYAVPTIYGDVKVYVKEFYTADDPMIDADGDQVLDDLGRPCYHDAGPVLLRKHFAVPLPTGDGFRCVPDDDDGNYTTVEYGGSFRFRLVIKDGYSDQNATVTVARMNTGAEISTVGETLKSVGVDKDGNKIYSIDNVTTDCQISVGIMLTETTDNIFTWLKRIIRLILNLFGITFDNEYTSTHTVTIVNSSASATYQAVSGTVKAKQNADKVDVLNGGQLVLKVIIDQGMYRKDPVTGKYRSYVEVKWSPRAGADEDYAEPQWYSVPDSAAGELYAIYVIDSITEDTTVTIRDT